MNVEERQTTLKDFVPICKLGDGAFSSVYKVQRVLDGQTYALKKVQQALNRSQVQIKNLKQKQRQNALNQVRLLASIDESNIIKYKQAFFDDKFQLLCIVMECADQGDLNGKIQTHQKHRKLIPEQQIWNAVRDIVRGLQALHNRNVLHRDIKTSNVFLCGGVYKLGDLNVSKVQSSASRLAFTQTGTPYYASPEVWRDQPYDSKSDIWSLGCIVYEMCQLKPPFRGSNMEELYKSIQKGHFPSLPPVYSQELVHLVNECLARSARHRPSCAQLLADYKTQLQRVGQINSHPESYIQHDTNTPKLLKTIKVDDLSQLYKSLPQAKYSKTTQKCKNGKNRYTNQKSQQSIHNQQIGQLQVTQIPISEAVDRSNSHRSRKKREVCKKIDEKVLVKYQTRCQFSPPSSQVVHDQIEAIKNKYKIRDSFRTYEIKNRQTSEDKEYIRDKNILYPNLIERKVQSAKSGTRACVDRSQLDSRIYKRNLKSVSAQSRSEQICQRRYNKKNDEGMRLAIFDEKIRCRPKINSEIMKKIRCLRGLSPLGSLGPSKIAPKRQILDSNYKQKTLKESQLNKNDSTILKNSYNAINKNEMKVGIEQVEKLKIEAQQKIIQRNPNSKTQNQYKLSDLTRNLSRQSQREPCNSNSNTPCKLRHPQSRMLSYKRNYSQNSNNSILYLSQKSVILKQQPIPPQCSQQRSYRNRNGTKPYQQYNSQIIAKRVPGTIITHGINNSQPNIVCSKAYQGYNYDNYQKQRHEVLIGGRFGERAWVREVPRIARIINKASIRQQLHQNQTAVTQNYYRNIIRNR